MTSLFLNISNIINRYEQAKKNILARYEQAKVDTLIAESGWHFWLGAKYDQENEVLLTIRTRASDLINL